MVIVVVEPKQWMVRMLAEYGKKGELGGISIRGKSEFRVFFALRAKSCVSGSSVKLERCF